MRDTMRKFPDGVAEPRALINRTRFVDNAAPTRYEASWDKRNPAYDVNAAITGWR